MTITEKKRQNSKHQPVGRWIRADKRLAVYLRDGFRCLTCERDLHGANPREVHLDHFHAKSAGGSNMEWNVFTSCAKCNCSRQDAPMDTIATPEQLARIRERLTTPLKPFLVQARDLMKGD